jgi:hypothetical protein
MDGIHHPGDQWLPFDCYPILDELLLLWLENLMCWWVVFLFFSFLFFSAIL